jgi:uncharacterized membrane protein (DUF4010 family)
VVLARHARADPALLGQAQTGIILATSIMYLRILIIVAMFNQSLAVTLAPGLIGLTVLGLSLAGIWYWLGAGPTGTSTGAQSSGNPLELNSALIFALLFILVSLAGAWTRLRFGEAGLFGLAGIVGLTDIDPFVLSIAEGGTEPVPIATAATAILIAASSNNILKAAYTVGFACGRGAIAPAGALVLLALSSGAIALWTVSVAG